MNKPVWRMNSGLGMPNDVKRFGEAIFNCGVHFALDSEPDEYYWHIDECASDIIAYQTNRTKAAKYERKHCCPCDGGGHLRYRGLDTCPHCNGKGYRLE